jgi:hypothetical protein
MLRIEIPIQKVIKGGYGIRVLRGSHECFLIKFNQKCSKNRTIPLVSTLFGS